MHKILFRNRESRVQQRQDVSRPQDHIAQGEADVMKEALPGSVQMDMRC